MSTLAWVLLIYTIPAEPSRKRASVWRALKRIGAVYLRDGVCALPDLEDTAGALRAVAATVEEFGGQATLVRAAQLEVERADAIVGHSRAARAAEYEEVAREAERIREHIRRESEHRTLTAAELAELEADLGKLGRWRERVRARDYFGAEEPGRLDALLGGCADELAAIRADVAIGGGVAE